MEMKTNIKILITAIGIAAMVIMALIYKTIYDYNSWYAIPFALVVILLEAVVAIIIILVLQGE